MGLEGYLDIDKSNDRNIPDEEKVNSLVEAIERVCNWKGYAEMDISEKNKYIWVEEFSGMSLGYYADNVDEIANKVESMLVNKGYKVSDGVYVNLRRKIIEPREGPEFYVLLLGIVNAPSDIEEEFDRFNGKLIKVKELPKEFEIRSSALGTFLLYRGFVCVRVFFSHSKEGWFNLTFDEPQSPEEYMKEYEERKKNA